MGDAIRWFRMYAEAVDDEKLRLLAFEDRWHFVALLCCKAHGLLDGSDQMARRKVAVKLGLDSRELEEVARRLAEVGLVDPQTLQPMAWDRRQFRSDDSKDRVKSYRERKKRYGNGDVTAKNRYGNGAVSSQETETEKEKNIRTHSRAVVCPESVPDHVWRDFQAIRKAKHSPLTATALRGIEREAAKAGMSLPDALAMCCERGWQGFNSAWVDRKQPAAGRSVDGSGRLKVAI
jgi:hypothetical protein